MKSLVEHPSRLDLDRLIAGVEDRDLSGVREHLENCGRCRSLTERLRREYGAYLEHYPTFEIVDDKVAGLAKPLRKRVDLRPLMIGATLAGAVATAALVLVVLRPAPDVAIPTSGIQIKGGSIIEMAVVRDGVAHRFSGQPLVAGDVLAFRYTTKRRFLLMVSLERSGKVNVFIADRDRSQSKPVTPGEKMKLKQGIRLDRSMSTERIIALLSDRPLDVGRIRRTLFRRFKALSDADRERLVIGKLSVEGEQISWVVRKARP